MGRVYEALRRASEAKAANGHGSEKAESHPQNQSQVERGREAPADLFARSPIFAPIGAHVSASTVHTEEFVGSALPDGLASRVAGATLDAAGSTRAADFPSVEVSAARVEPHLVAITEPRSPYCEQFRSLRTSVLHAAERHKLQAFVLTSAGVMEGKTLTSLNLSWLLAQTDGVRALLVDGDLRHPCAAEYLGLDAPVGLSEVLAGEAELRQTILRVEPSGLYLLPGGAARDDVAELLSGPKFLQVLGELRRMFNYIIIDAPPLGIFTDATVLINRADSAILVVRSGKTSYTVVDSLIEHLPHERLLGVVLNGTDEQLNESDYYYQRRYYQRSDTAVVEETTKVTEEEVVAS